ncbi:Uncharacterised protein [Mycobacteroides abscessus subsp. abscessus]|nr:Uncharacterised protein [Mycobacteroides abscessus subsp. abscessus]
MKLLFGDEALIAGVLVLREVLDEPDNGRDVGFGGAANKGVSQFWLLALPTRSGI